MSELRKAECLYRLWNGELLLVTVADWQNDPAAARTYYQSFRLYIGREGEPLERIDVTHADRARDGGTTIVETEGPRLFLPSPWLLAAGRQHGPRWDEHEITELAVEDFNVSEADGSPAIVTRIKTVEQKLATA